MIRAPRPLRTVGLILALLFWAVAPAAAQRAEPEAQPARAEVDGAELPRALAEEIVDFFNRVETMRIWGAAQVPAGAELAGDVAVVGGALVVAGRVRGRVVVINGDVRLEPGAELLGELRVVGGAVIGPGAAELAADVVAYPQPLRYRREQDHIVYAPYRAGSGLTAGRDLGFGRAGFFAGSRQGYNRVEGLPIALGPTLALGRSNPTRLDALLIRRSETGFRFARRELGYVVRLEQAFGGHRALRAGVTLHSEIVPIESWGLTNREASLATFVLHRDYRDHYERIGHAVYAGFGSAAHPLDLMIEYRDERHHTVAARGPWALFGNNREWRAQPSVSGGELRSLSARVRYDTRNVTGDVSTGWFLVAELEQGLGGTLGDAVRLDPELGAPTFGWTESNHRFTSTFLDLRRYVRLGPDSRLALRALAAGSVDGKPLPVQRQRALGGEGSLPGYRLFAFDCGARRHTLDLLDSRFHPYYGCDRLMLMQFEYEARLPFTSGLVRRLGWPLDAIGTPAGVVFVNSGRAWNEPDALRGRGKGQEDFATDVGAGLRLGRIGLYLALPLSGGAGTQGLNFFVRIGSRL